MRKRGILLPAFLISGNLARRSHRTAEALQERGIRFLRWLRWDGSFRVTGGWLNIGRAKRDSG